jgi:hypothetical protein
MEVAVLKQLSICAVLIAFATGTANAQERAVLRKIEAPGAGFDVLIATPKSPGGASYSLSESPDALVIHLVGGELALEFDDVEKMVKALDFLRRPIGAFRMESPDRRLQIPIALYIVPAGE